MYMVGKKLNLTPPDLCTVREEVVGYNATLKNNTKKKKTGNIDETAQQGWCDINV